MRIARIIPSRRVWFFDLDNTLHDASTHVFPSMHRQINAYLQRHHDLDETGANEKRRELWMRYGTTLKGLVRRHGDDPRRFLRETHLFPELDRMVRSQPALRHAIARLGGRRFVFSNAPRRYVEDVLRIIGMRRWFEAVYSIEDSRYSGKPSFESFHVLLRNHDLDPHRCALVDDMLENLRTAKRLGLTTVWISPERRKVSFVDFRVASVIDLPRLVFRHAI